MATDINLTPTAGMPPITTVTSGSSSGTGTEAIQPSIDALAAGENQVSALQNQANAQATVAPAHAAAVEGQAQGEDIQAAQIAADNEERNKLVASRMPAIQEAESQAKQAEQRFEGHQFYDYLANRSTGDKILSKISIALVAGVNAYKGIAGNQLAEELKHKVDLDFEKQKINLHSAEEIAKWKREGVTDLYGHLQNELAALDVKHAKALEATKLKVQAMGQRAGIPEDEAKNNVTVASLDAAAQGKKLESAQRYEAHGKANRERTASTSETSAKAGAVSPVYDATGAPMGNTDVESARKVNTELGFMRQARDTMQQLADSYKEHGLSLDPSVIRDRRAMQEEIKSLM